MNPIIIIGSGMAGYTLAREFRKLDKDTPVTIISQNDGTNYAKPTLSNALTANKAPEQIGLGDAAKMQDTLSATILTQTSVARIDTAANTIDVVKNGATETLNYSKLVLAVGANVIKLPLQGDAAEQTLWVNDLDDYKVFREKLAAKDSAHIAIIGAGLIGCEFANDLINAGHKATVIDLADRPLSRLLPADISEGFASQLSDFGVNFQLGTSVKSVNASSDHLTIDLENGESLQADVLLSAVGLRSNIALAEQTGLSCNRGIVVDSLLKTSSDDVYAIGDCAEVGGHVLPYVMPLMQQARALAKTLAGNTTPIHYPAMPVGVKTPAAPLVVLPVPEGVDASWSSENTEDGMIAKATDSSGTLRGFVLLGKDAGKQRMALAKEVPDLIAAS